MPQVVFFDAAGTLFHPREPVDRTYTRIARSYGAEVTEAEVRRGFYRAFGSAPPLSFGPDHSAARLRELEREWWRRLVGQTFNGIGGPRDFEGCFEELFGYFAQPGSWRADPEAEPVLARLKDSGLGLGVISNFDHRVYRILDAIGLGPWFESMTISSEAGYAKPAREIFELAMVKHSVSAAESLHVGDSSEMDLRAARAAGMGAVLIDAAAREASAYSTDSRSARLASLAYLPEVAQRLRFA